MKLEKYHKLKLRLEVFKFEKNYLTLNQVLYYFSFLGNIFLIYFGYFFVKSVTDSIPTLFPYQDTFFTIFVALFLTGYELTKRFAIEQWFVSVLQLGKATISIVVGGLLCLGLVTGSFYLSIKGAHRLVDNTEKIQTLTDESTTKQLDSIGKYYDKEIAYYRSQPGRTRQDRFYRDSIVASLTSAKEAKLNQIENKTQSKSNIKLEQNEENSTAFIFITIFLEFLILLGVGFNSFYTIGSYNETTKLLQTPKFKQLDLNLRLLKLYYQNGKKEVGDVTLSYSKFRTLVETQKIDCLQKELKAFITLCQELDITKSGRGNRKEFSISYQQAKELIERQEVV